MLHTFPPRNGRIGLAPMVPDQSGRTPRGPMTIPRETIST